MTKTERTFPNTLAGLMAACLLLATLPVLAGTAEASHPKGVILVVDLNGGSNPWIVPSLTAAGYAPCTAPRPPICFDVITTQAAFYTEANGGFQGRKVLYVGGADVNSVTATSLTAKKTQIATFVSAGGALIVYSSPYTQAAYDFVPAATVGSGCPSSATLCTTYSSANTVTKTTFGNSHDTLNGVTNAQLSGWASSYHQYFTKKPAYLSVLANNGNTAQWVILAGIYGNGCVYVSGQDLAWHASNLNWNGGAAAASPKLVKQSVDWGLLCGCPIHYDTDIANHEETRPFVLSVEELAEIVEAFLAEQALLVPCEVTAAGLYVLCDGTVWQESNGMDGLQRYETRPVHEHGEDPGPITPADTQLTSLPELSVTPDCTTVPRCVADAVARLGAYGSNVVASIQGYAVSLENHANDQAFATQEYAQRHSVTLQAYAAYQEGQLRVYTNILAGWGACFVLAGTCGPTPLPPLGTPPSPEPVPVYTPPLPNVPPPPPLLP